MIWKQRVAKEDETFLYNIIYTINCVTHCVLSNCAQVSLTISNFVYCSVTIVCFRSNTPIVSDTCSTPANFLYVIVHLRGHKSRVAAYDVSSHRVIESNAPIAALLLSEASRSVYSSDGIAIGEGLERADEGKIDGRRRERASVDEKVKGFRCVCASRTAGTGAASSAALLAVATATYMTLY